MDVLPAEIETPRLVLRQWQDEQVDDLAAAIRASLDHLRPWMPWVVMEPLSRIRRLDLIRSWRNDQQSGGDSVFGIFADDVVVGGCGLHRRSGPETLEIGYWIHVDHARRGYASEASAALTTAAFDQPGITAVEIHHDQANVASAGVPRALGYEFVGEQPDEITAPGEVGIDCAWRVTADRWPTG